jgi:3-O-methylgallate 3,4-dioxygenase
MAELVLGIGTSHTPMLNARVEDWPRFAERDSARPHLDRDGRDITYARLIAAAGPQVARYLTPQQMAESHGTAMRCMADITALLESSRLDALIVVGDDQKELYFENNLPSVLIYYGDTIRNAPRGASQQGNDWYRPIAARYYEEGAPRDFPVDSRLARHLIGQLVDADFDIATANTLPDGMGEGHAFGFVHKRLMNGLALPIVPVFLNTYYPPNQPTPRRCYRLGQAIRRAVESFPGDARVGIVASGGLSHFTVDEELDGAVVKALREKDAESLQSLPRNKLNSGSSEIRNWICVAGAVEALDLDWVVYRPGYRTPAGTGTGLCFAAWQ